MKFYDHLIECHQEVSYKRNKKKKKKEINTALFSGEAIFVKIISTPSCSTWQRAEVKIGKQNTTG